MAELWLTCEQFAALAGLPQRTARHALRQAGCGRPVKHWLVKVRALSGRGGQSGRRFHVALSSLPGDLQERFRASQEVRLPLFDAPAGPVQPRLAQGQWQRQQALYAIIEPAVRPGLTDAERIEAKKALIAAGHSKSSLYRWIGVFEREGLAGLGRLKPANAGKRRVVASAEFHRAYNAAAYPDELLPELDAFVDRSIKGLWKGKASIAGETEVRDLAGFLLWEECQRLECPLPREVCVVSTHRVDQWRAPFEAVAKKNLHAKAFADSLPRIARDWTKLDPMECVIADVKHLDVMVTRPDGSTTYPKLIGFMDGGTGRVFPYLVQCPQRYSITQELVIEAFLAMAQHPEWGLPRQLYLDNGSEFGGLDKITPALALLRGGDGKVIVRAQPYNASAKPIEPLFRRLDLYCFASMTGYTGPNRMDKRTQNVGKAPQAYTGPWEAFREEVGMLIAYYHQKKVGGQWNASPDEVFRAKLEHWRPTFARPLALEMAFCKSGKLRLYKDGVKHRGGRYHHPELLNVAIGTQLDVLIPWQRDKAPIVTLPDRHPFQLLPDFHYAANDTAGSIESSSRKRTYLKGVAARDREVTTIHPADVKRRIVGGTETVRMPGRVQYLDQGSASSDLARIGATIEHQPVAELDAAARRRAREDRITENLLKEQARARQ